jgi:hypothetical protein
MRAFGVSVMSALPGLSIDEQQWLLIVKSDGRCNAIPNDTAEALAAKGLISEIDGAWSLTEAGAAEAERISALDFQLNAPPPEPA